MPGKIKSRTRSETEANPIMSKSHENKEQIEKQREMCNKTQWTSSKELLPDTRSAKTSHFGSYNTANNVQGIQVHNDTRRSEATILLLKDRVEKPI